MLKFIKTQVNENTELLDVGCGDRKISSQLNCKKIVTLDAWDKVNPDVLIDLEKADLPFEENSFDTVLMLDFIEHVEKERGFELIEQVKKIARKNIILLTPLWWQDNSENVNNPSLWCYGNKFDYHKSLWTIEDFKGWTRNEGVSYLKDYFFGVYYV